MNKLVNWQGQMKMSPEHLRQTENYFISELRNARLLVVDKNRYGLLPISNAEREVEIQIREHLSTHVEVILYSCSAITLSGEFIYINDSRAGKALSGVFNPEDRAQNKDIGSWDIILAISPFDRVAVGELNQDEYPPRHPDCDRVYKLHIMPSDDINVNELGSHYLIIGKIYKEGGDYVVDSNYIPPSFTMSSHPVLRDYAKDFDMMFYNLRRYSQNIITKVYKTMNSELALNIQNISKSFLAYIASISFKLSNNGDDLSPIEFSEFVTTFASKFYVELICIPSVQKDELLQYLYEWSDVSPGALDELLSKTMELEYIHKDLRSVMVKLDEFLQLVNNLWERLNNLEFIGQHKESLIVSVSGGANKARERKGFLFQD